MTFLHFCDGCACDEAVKEICYTKGGNCLYTSDKNHALSNSADFNLPTRFVKFSGRESCITEFIDESALIYLLLHNKKVDIPKHLLEHAKYLDELKTFYESKALYEAG